MLASLVGPCTSSRLLPGQPSWKIHSSILSAQFYTPKKNLEIKICHIYLWLFPLLIPQRVGIPPDWDPKLRTLLRNSSLYWPRPKGSPKSPASLLGSCQGGPEPPEPSHRESRLFLNGHAAGNMSCSTCGKANPAALFPNYPRLTTRLLFKTGSEKIFACCLSHRRKINTSICSRYLCWTLEHASEMAALRSSKVK